ncbi:hypothetical protein [Nocardiopsis dassonvillei]|uniref:hypothetical protein n=1 Tax=Nocardiopsis dassonvillei TaxID=2014 RepID=UPI00362878E5
MIEAMGHKALAVRADSADAGAVVDAVAHLAGPGGRFVTGTVVSVDGGFSA